MAVMMIRPKSKATKIAYNILGKPANIANPKVKKEFKDSEKEQVRTNVYYSYR